MLARSSAARRNPDAHDIVVVGAACLDIKGRLHNASVANTSNPGVVRLSIGGCARNVAENLARLGASTVLISAVCQDDFGRTIIQRTARAGVNTDYVVISCDQHSAAYMALLDSEGQLILGVDDTGATNAITPAIIEEYADVLTSAQMVMIDANLPIKSALALLHVCQAAGVPVGIDPVAYGPALRYRDYIGQFSLVRPNAVEAQALTGMPIETVDHAIHAAKYLVGLGVEVAIITLANSGVVYATSDANGHVPAIAVEVVDPTGASDALTATVMYALLNDIPIDEAVRLGVSAAALTLGSTETVCRELSLETLYAQLVI